MKKLILILSVLLLVACSGGNRGYGYNVKTEIPTQTPQTNTNTQKSEGFFERTSRRERERTMYLYNPSGDSYGASIYVYKGTYDGHDFYVFQDGDGLSVIPVAMCEYYENLLKSEE